MEKEGLFIMMEVFMKDTGETERLLERDCIKRLTEVSISETLLMIRNMVLGKKNGKMGLFMKETM